MSDPTFQPLQRLFQLDDLPPELGAAEVHRAVTIEAEHSPAEDAALLTNARIGRTA